MHRWGVSETSACECGSEVQAYTHILQECPIWKPSCHITEVDNPLLQNYLQNCNFWPELFFFLCFFFVYTNDDLLFTYNVEQSQAFEWVPDIMVISHLSQRNVSSKRSIARQYEVKIFLQKLNLHFSIIFCEVRRNRDANLNGCELNW